MIRRSRGVPQALGLALAALLALTIGLLSLSGDESANQRLIMRERSSMAQLIIADVRKSQRLLGTRMAHT